MNINLSTLLNITLMLTEKIEELTKEIRSLTNNLSLTKQELSDYKQKAARILQVFNLTLLFPLIRLLFYFCLI